MSGETNILCEIFNNNFSFYEDDIKYTIPFFFKQSSHDLIDDKILNDFKNILQEGFFKYKQLSENAIFK